MARKSVEANREYYKKYYSEHKEEHKKAQDKYHENHPRVHVPDSLRNHRIQYLYKMTPEMYESQLKEQGGHCALCNTVQGDEKRRMAVDHDHNCCPGQRSCVKCRRGILCANCNRKLGFLEDVLADALVFPFLGKSDSWVGRALRYLNKFNLRLVSKDTTAHYPVADAALA